MNPEPGPSWRTRPARILGLAVVYYLTGKLGLLLAISPGYATALWPPSGIALAALLILGNSAWPGILLGSFLVNLSTMFDPTSGAAIAKSIGIAAAIGAGATVQAVLGAGLIRRWVGWPLELVRKQDIVKFLLLGGPVACVANATISMGVLALSRRIQPSQIAFSWWTWWVGDLIGVVVVAPLVLIALAEPREVWRRRVRTVAVPLILMLVLITALFIGVSAWERAAITARFQKRSEALAAAVRERLEESVEVLRPLESHHAANPVLSRKSFRSLVESPLARYPSLQALSWNPRVLDADRPLFERGGPEGTEGACRITVRDARERLVAASRRSEYVPIRYIEPYEKNAAAVGYDVSSSIVRFEALKRACDSGLPSVTRSMRLVQESDSFSGLAVFLPVYANGESRRTPEERRRDLVGYFASVVRLKDFLRPVEEQAKTEGIDVFVEDSESVAGSEPFWQSFPETGGSPEIPAEFRHSTAFAFAGRNWSAVCRATPAYVSGARSWKPWGILAGGMVLAGCLGAILLAWTGRASAPCTGTAP